MVLRDPGLEKSSLVVTLVAKRPKSEELLLLAGVKPLNAKDTASYRSITIRVNYCLWTVQTCHLSQGSQARGMKSPATKDLEEFKRVRRCLACRYSVTQNMLETCDRENPDLQWQSCGKLT